MGWLADRMPKKQVMLIIYLLVAASIPLLFMASLAAARCTRSPSIFGLGLGGEYLIIPLMAAELFGVKVLGRLLGVVLTADGVAEAVSPMLHRLSARRDGQLPHRIRRPHRRCAGRSGGHSRAAVTGYEAGLTGC